MSGRAGLDTLERDKPDLVVLDLGLPDLDGVEVCRQMRQASSVPILVLSARGAEGDKVAALDAGADDYVTKPFGSEELLARIRAALRRSDSAAATSGPIVRGALVIDRDRFRVLRDGEEVRLTPKEFELLTYLAQHPGRVLTHRTLLKAIWGRMPPISRSTCESWSDRSARRSNQSVIAPIHPHRGRRRSRR